MSVVSVGRRRVGILGGGVTGLAAAFYLQKKFGDKIDIVLFEKSHRMGGWIKSINRGENFFETGARTLRPTGLNGMNTLDLIEDIRIDTEISYIDKQHPVAQNRFIYTRGDLVRLPTHPSVLWKKIPPFSKPLIISLLRDIFKSRHISDDDTMHNFIHRRFGHEIANTIADPLIRGICGGNSKEISVKMLMREFYEYEQIYGSVIFGLLATRLSRKEEEMKQHEKDIGFSKLATTSLTDNWSIYTFSNGIETLPKGLENYLKNFPNITLYKNSEVRSLVFESSTSAIVQTIREGKEERAKVDFLISSIPSWHLANILRHSTPQHSVLSQVLNVTSSSSIIVASLMYSKNDIISESLRGFGFLVPSSEVELKGLLGVSFDTSAFPQSNVSILTLMMKADDRNVYIMKQGGKEDKNELMQEILRKSKRLLKKTLMIDEEVADFHVEISSSAIPQYTVGHFERIKAARKFISHHDIPLRLAGASYDGVGINDCIMSAKAAVQEVQNIFDPTPEFKTYILPEPPRDQPWRSDRES